MVIQEALSEEVPLPWDVNDELAPGGMESLGQRAEPKTGRLAVLVRV